MAINSSFGFTNSTPMSGVTIVPTDIKPVTVYARVSNTPTDVKLSNKTAPIDQAEMLSYKCVNIPKVNTDLTVRHPGAVTDGIQYIVRLDEILRSSCSDECGAGWDDPIVMYLTIRHPVSGQVTASVIETIFKRLCGALLREDGTYRFDDLMRGAIDPQVD